MILHILNKSPGKCSAFQDMLNAVAKNDAIILIEDAVITSLSPASEALVNKGVPIYALEADIIARGLSDKTNTAIQVVDDKDFVNLCCAYSKTVSWF